MEAFNFSFPLIVFLTLSLVIHSSHAQNSPEDYLNAHNEVRARLGLNGLTWNTTLESMAQGWAQERAKDCQLVHSDKPQSLNIGENLCLGFADFTGAQAVQLWVEEVGSYDYASNGCAPDKQCGHYTQVVWRDTQQVGCARTKCNSQDFQVIVCNYYPCGNVIGEKPY